MSYYYGHASHLMSSTPPAHSAKNVYSFILVWCEKDLCKSRQSPTKESYTCRRSASVKRDIPGGTEVSVKMTYVKKINVLISEIKGVEEKTRR